MIGAPLAIFSKVLDLMRATLARQSGSRKPLLRPRRTTQRTVVIGARPAPLLPQNGLLTSTACTFSTTCVFAYLCSFRGSVVIRVRPAPSLDQYGLLASTACTFLRRLMFIMFGRHILTGGGEVLQPYIYIYIYIYINKYVVRWALGWKTPKSIKPTLSSVASFELQPSKRQKHSFRQ